jgi:peptidyl-prolyl cis-trans isomerase C
MRVKPVLFSFALMISASAAADVATVNGQPVTEAQVIAANPAAKNNPASIHSTADVLINRILLEQKAKAAGIENSDAFRQTMAKNRENLLISLYLNQYFTRHPITKAEIQARYDEIVKSAPKREYRLREIIVANDSDAQKILAELRTGASFSNLAATHSQGPNPVLGGELGWLSKEQIPAPILTHLASLKPLEVLGPLSVPEGFAIVQFMGERPATVLPLTAVSARIEEDLRNQKTAAYLKQLRKKAHIQWQRSAAAKPTPAATAGGAS